MPSRTRTQRPPGRAFRHQRAGLYDLPYSLTKPLGEAWAIVWVFSALLRLKQDHGRRERLAAAKEALEDLKRRLASPKTRLRKPWVLEDHIERILQRHTVKRYLIPSTRIETFLVR